MNLASPNCLIILAQALDEYRHRICDDIDSKKIAQASSGDYELYLMQVEQALDAVEEAYEAKRKNQPDLMPFIELLKYKR